jgi:hypothetical protein
MSWNYRILTKVVDLPSGMGKRRIFFIGAVYYDEDENPTSYGDKDTSFLNDDETVEEAKSSFQFILDKVTISLTKPVLDCDNWPNEYIELNT